MRRKREEEMGFLKIEKNTKKMKGKKIIGENEDQKLRKMGCNREKWFI